MEVTNYLLTGMTLQVVRYLILETYFKAAITQTTINGYDMLHMDTRVSAQGICALPLCIIHKKMYIVKSSKLFQPSRLQWLEGQTELPKQEKLKPKFTIRGWSAETDEVK